jgi:osmotically inducible protein OsmC
MAAFERHATVNWTGGLMDGSGDAKAGTGAFSLPVTFPSRIEDPAGRTSPEELMAAAHAACYAMALNHTLGTRGASAERTDVTSKIIAELNNGITIHTAALSVTVYGLKGLDAAEFPAVAAAAEQGCPVSKAYRGSLTITLDARVG